MFAKYQALVQAIMDHGVEETNERTGRRIKVLPHQGSFVVDLSSGRLPLPGNRRVFPRTAAVEVAWFLQGGDHVDFLHEHKVHIWDKFTNAGGYVVGPYGRRWRKEFGRDQIADAVDALALDPTNRRVYVTAWDPEQDYPRTMLNEQAQKAVPCPIGFTLSVVDGAVNMSLFIRSSDVFVGLPYDVMGHAMLLDAVASSLERKPGWLGVTLGHAHIYEPHWEMAREGLKATWAEKPRMLGWPVERIEKHPAEYIEQTQEAAKLVRWPDFNPKPELVA